MSQWWSAMGPLGWPLALCSLVALALILERFWLFIGLQPLGQAAARAAVSACRTCDREQCQGRAHGWRYGLALLLKHSTLPALQREELLGCWLLEERQRLHRQLRLLQLIERTARCSVCSTVLGMLDGYPSIAGKKPPGDPGATGRWPVAGPVHHRLGAAGYRPRAGSRMGLRRSGPSVIWKVFRHCSIVVSWPSVAWSWSCKR